MTNRMRYRMAVALALAATLGCGASDASGPSADVGFTSGQATAFAGQIARAFSNAMNETNLNRAPAWTTIGAGGPITPVLINQQVTSRTSCTAGGNITVSGSASGSIGDQTGSGMITIQIIETITDWKCIGGMTINGDPYISGAGAITFLNFQQSSTAQFDFGGGIKWGTTADRSCSIRMTILARPDGTGRASGVVCGQGVDVSV